MAAPGQQQLFSRLTKAQIQSTDDATRFVIELEFIQSLANPQYLNWLAQNRYLSDPAFINYLKYLLYWKEPQYIVYIKYPHCLQFLDLLQNADFRIAIASNAVADAVFKQQFFFWHHFRRNRVKELIESGAQLCQPPGTGTGLAAGAGSLPAAEGGVAVKSEPEAGGLLRGPADMAEDMSIG